MNGEIIMKHSADMPVYWATLDQYMTHSGLDIAAPQGTSVSACSGGTITRIEEDDRFGITMEINHGDGLISVYGNLSGDDLAELGEVVSTGDDIGKTGKTSLFEFDSPDHLHFEMRKDGEPVDPGDYIDFVKYELRTDPYSTSAAPDPPRTAAPLIRGLFISGSVTYHRSGGSILT